MITEIKTNSQGLKTYDIEIFILSFLIMLCLIISSGGNKHLMGKCFPISFCINVTVNLSVIYSCLFKKIGHFHTNVIFLCGKYAEFLDCLLVRAILLLFL